MCRFSLYFCYLLLSFPKWFDKNFLFILDWFCFVFFTSITSFPVDWNVDTSAEEERAKTCPRNMNAGRGAYQRGHVPLFLPESHPHREEKICPTEGAISGGIIRGTAALQMECEVFKAYGHKFFICIRLWGRRGGRPARLQLRGLSEACVWGGGALGMRNNKNPLFYNIWTKRCQQSQCSAAVEGGRYHQQSHKRHRSHTTEA